MADVNNTFQTVSSHTKDNTMMHAESTGKATYVSPTLVHIGSVPDETSAGAAGFTDAGIFS